MADDSSKEFVRRVDTLAEQWHLSRQGDSASGKGSALARHIFNRTITLKDAWVKELQTPG